ncbi:hypothetical protein AYO20_07006 [Fonsecaea nubica]|uniref:Mid2 domain-containing protein n=1 Tax=Fonsecaea nubica TaxID=856822 RepID=A0A178CV10_9EURO|nr:hypothetical protein AYO20_07006 [Fonsecaea nubica]OAL33668.1 hypothetical protein AYO20_07006 [Fonsecaea nubica]
MYRPAHPRIRPRLSETRPHLLFLVLLHLLNVAALEITYPKIGTVYPTKGPLDVQWQSTSEFDAVELAIYLATYSGQTLKSEQRCIVAVIDDGSTAITLSQPPPDGDSWTWMFYDDLQTISLGNNYIAQSVHFQFQSPTPTPTPSPSTTSTPSTKNSSVGLSPGVAAAIGIGGTLVVVGAGLFVGYCCFYRRWQRKKRETISAIPYTPGHRYSKQELDSKPGTAYGVHTHSIPHADMKLPTQHEMEVYPGRPPASVPSNSAVSPGAELSVKARHSHLPPQHGLQPTSPYSELALSPLRHEMYHDPRRPLPQELPGDMDMNLRHMEPE